MSLRAGEHIFNHVHYDAESDILYSSKVRPQPTVGDDTPEGHSLNFNDADELVGLDLHGPQRIVEREGLVRVTLPDGNTVEVEGVAEALKQPA